MGVICFHPVSVLTVEWCVCVCVCDHHMLCV